jgi:hypothetical protein
MTMVNDAIGNRTHDLPVCTAVPQPTAPLQPQNSITEKEEMQRVCMWSRLVGYDTVRSGKWLSIF